MVVSYLLKGNDPPERLMPVEEYYESMRKYIPQYSKLFRPTVSQWSQYWQDGWLPADAVVELLQAWQ